MSRWGWWNCWCFLTSSSYCSRHPTVLLWAHAQSGNIRCSAALLPGLKYLQACGLALIRWLLELSTSVTNNSNPIYSLWALKNLLYWVKEINETLLLWYVWPIFVKFFYVLICIKHGLLSFFIFSFAFLCFMLLHFISLISITKYLWLLNHELETVRTRFWSIKFCWNVVYCLKN